MSSLSADTLKRTLTLESQSPKYLYTKQLLDEYRSNNVSVSFNSLEKILLYTRYAQGTLATCILALYFFFWEQPCIVLLSRDRWSAVIIGPPGLSVAEIYAPLAIISLPPGQLHGTQEDSRSIHKNEYTKEK